MISDLSGGTISGSLPLVTSMAFSGVPNIAGPIGWSLNTSSTGVNLVTPTAIVAVTDPHTPTSTFLPTTINTSISSLTDTFLAKFEEALDAQQKSDDDKKKLKEAIVVEGETCKP
jgi:hypothetical protein